jgi:GH15 family glucan-1,4-alpha-glucosidase
MTTIALSRLRELAGHSRAVIRANQTPSGAYLASPTFAVYRYSWLRDGAFIADAMSRAGEIGSAEAFFGWCDSVIRARAGQVASLLAQHANRTPIEKTEFLPTRYTVDGAEAGGDWWDFQLDGYGAWLWALGAHALRHRRPVEPYLEGAALSGRYVTAFWQHPSYDWWEEHSEQVHVSTLAAIGAGLRAAAGWPNLPGVDQREFAAAADAIRRRIAGDAARVGHLAKWLGSETVDASLIAASTPFGMLEPGDPVMRATVERIERDLVHGGGVHRYATDSYFGGGEWLLLSALLGWHRLRAGDPDGAWRQLEWVAAQATPTGDLPEQVSHHLLVPEKYNGWVERWGPVATPLLWSHAMYLTLAVELGVTSPGGSPR